MCADDMVNKLRLALVGCDHDAEAQSTAAIHAATSSLETT